MSATVTLSKPRSANSAKAASTVCARLAARLRSRSPSTCRPPAASTRDGPHRFRSATSGIVCLVALYATRTRSGIPGAPMPSTPTAAAVLDPASAEPDDHWHPQQITALAVVAVCGVLVSLTQSILIPVLGALQQDLGSSTT